MSFLLYISIILLCLFPSDFLALTFLDFQVGSMLLARDRSWTKNNKDYVDCTPGEAFFFFVQFVAVCFIICNVACVSFLSFLLPFAHVSDVIGSLGCVRAIDYQREEVLLSFYDDDEAVYFEWWFPLAYLKLPAAPTTTTTSNASGSISKSGSLSTSSSSVSASQPTVSPVVMTPSALTAACVSARPLSTSPNAANPVLDVQVAKLSTCLGDLSLVYAHRIVLAFVLNDACPLTNNNSNKLSTTIGETTASSESSKKSSLDTTSDSVIGASLAPSDALAAPSPTIDVDTVLLLTGT
jgi:hypothetical protein